MTEEFRQLVSSVAQFAAQRPVDSALEDSLNRSHGPDSDWYRRMREACVAGIAEGWLCRHEAGGIRYGRVIKPGPGTAQFSVDVVDMADVAGPHHSHPAGEIDLVMPLEGEALFDGASAGWKVYPPGSAHRPTVTQGRALVLYLLPEGRIEFTRA